MTIELDILRKVSVYEEPAGSYQVDHTGTPGDFLDVPYVEGSLQIDGDQVLLDPAPGRLAPDGYSVQVLGPKKCTVGLEVTLHSHGLDLDGDVAAPTTSTWALLRMLKAVLGGSFATTNPGAQTTVQAGSTATVVNVTTGHGARFTKGGVIACQVVSGSSQIELQEVLSVTGDAVSVKEAFSAAPVEGTPVRGGVTVHVTSDPDTSLQVVVEGRELDDRFVFRGLQGGLSLTLPIGQTNALPKIGFALEGPSWAMLSAGAAVPAAPSYAHFSPIRGVDAPLTVPTVGSTTRVPVCQGEIKIELPGLAYEDLGCGSSDEGVKRKRRLAGRPLVRGSFTCPFEDDTWFAAFAARSPRAIFQQFGVLPGSAWLISVPTVQIGQPKRVAQGSIAGQMVPFIGRPDESLSSPTTDAHTSPIRFHFV